MIITNVWTVTPHIQRTASNPFNVQHLSYLAPFSTWRRCKSGFVAREFYHCTSLPLVNASLCNLTLPRLHLHFGVLTICLWSQRADTLASVARSVENSVQLEQSKRRHVQTLTAPIEGRLPCVPPAHQPLFFLQHRPLHPSYVPCWCAIGRLRTVVGELESASQECRSIVTGLTEQLQRYRVAATKPATRDTAAGRQQSRNYHNRKASSSPTARARLPSCLHDACCWPTLTQLAG
jgi:hypothetical protein